MARGDRKGRGLDGGDPRNRGHSRARPPATARANCCLAHLSGAAGTAVQWHPPQRCNGPRRAPAVLADAVRDDRRPHRFGRTAQRAAPRGTRGGRRRHRACPCRVASLRDAVPSCRPRCGVLGGAVPVASQRGALGHPDARPARLRHLRRRSTRAETPAEKRVVLSAITPAGGSRHVPIRRPAC